MLLGVDGMFLGDGREDGDSSSDEEEDPLYHYDHRAREIRAAWRAKWSGRRRPVCDTGEGLKRLWKTPAMDSVLDAEVFDLSPAAFASSEPVEIEAANECSTPPPEVETSPRADTLHWSPRGVEDDDPVTYRPKRELLSDLEDEPLARHDVRLSLPDLSCVAFPQFDDGRSSTWPISPRGTDVAEAHHRPTAISCSYLLPRCCFSPGDGERTQ